MSAPIDYQILLQEVVRTARTAAQQSRARGDAEGRAALFAYYDILDVLKTQAELMEVPLADLDLADQDLEAMLVEGRREAA